MMPPSPLKSPLGCFRVRGQNARKAPSPPLTLLRVRGQGGIDAADFEGEVIHKNVSNY
jgi:hypothetical protein